MLPSLTEKEIINKYLTVFENKLKKDFFQSVSLKKIQIQDPVDTELYKEYKDGYNSTKVEVNFELYGYKSYSDDNLESILNDTKEASEDFYPIAEVDVFSLNKKGKYLVQIIFDFVFIKYGVEQFEENNSGLDSKSKKEIISQIEFKLSEIYTLLKKL